MSHKQLPLKLAMARAIARKIVENPSKFGSLSATAEDFLKYPNPEYWTLPGNNHRWEKDAHYWQPIARHLPEILEKLACTENVQ